MQLFLIRVLLFKGCNMTKKLKEIRYDKNPFIENMVVPIGKRSVKLSPLGRDDNILVNEATGEVRGTHVTTYRKVDSEKFVKLFTANIALTFNLNAAGIKSFNVLMFAIQSQAINRDVVTLDKFTLEDFLAVHSLKLSYATFMRGLKELEQAKIIAKHKKRGDYFINPNFVFSGDRIAFTTVIERQDISEEQQELNLD